MKEFVEKLIERLDKKTRWVAYGNWDRDIGMTHKVVPFGNIKEIVNQLAEEYKKDSTKKNQGWIPVTERLPSKNESWYLAEEPDYYEPNEFIVQVEGAEFPTVAFFDGECFCDRGGHDCFLSEVIAWQPLPEPYNPSKSSNLDNLSQEPKTRIEYIRSMSMEELADAILERSEISTAIDFCQNFCGECEHIPESECRKCLIKYLNSPVEHKKTIPTEHFNERFNRVL